MKLQVCLDRFEGDKAVLLSEEEQLVCPRAFLPPEAAEGDILSLNFEIDTIATEEVKAEAAKLLQDLIKKS